MRGEGLAGGGGEAWPGMTSGVVVVVMVGGDALLLAHAVEVAGMMAGHACWMAR